MNKLYVIVDKFGFIGAYNSKERAQHVVNCWTDQVDLMIISFPINPDLPLEEIYFLPYRGHETDNKFPVALVSNDRDYILKVQQKMVSMEMTYPDNIKFFTKKINTIDPIEYSRLVDKKLRYKEEFIDQILSKISEADEDELSKPFDEMMAGIIVGPYDILSAKSDFLHPKNENDSESLNK